ncbi:MAG TPA: glycine zipper 2TM domain-containing protein [Luteimonas sp.]|nr:glycine zipper 2TM domain-containing protein [Luteimonas sp.]
MNRLTASILALGLAASAGTVSAQSSGYYSQYGSQYGQSQYGQSQYGQPTVDRYGQGSGANYDYARVLRVDPVIGSGYGRSGYGYPASNTQRCYSRQDTYAGNDPYGNNGYGNNGYGNDGYNNNGYGNSGYYGNDGYNNNGYRGGSTAGSNVATVIGGLLGAAVGSQVGGGSARYATAAIGSMVGGMAGRQVYQNSQRTRYPRTGTVQVCDPVPVGYGNSNGYGNNYGSGNGYYTGNGGVTAYDVTYEYGGRNYTTRTNYNPGNRIRVRVDVRPE